jgi:hypothetical protein
LAKAWPFWTLLLIGAAHRLLLYARFSGALDHLIAQNPGYVTMQLLPIQGYEAHFWRSMWLLQQTPPLLHLVVKVALLFVAWPFGVAGLLCLFNGLLTVLTSCLISSAIARITHSRAIGFFTGLAFMLSTDVVVLEYALFGQTFYEQMGMFGAALSFVLLLDVECHRRAKTQWRRAFWAGLTIALTALCRSSLCYLPLAVLVFGCLRWRRNLIIAFLVPVALLQLGWGIKNEIAYGHFSIEGSSWSGLNAERGFVWAGQQQQLCQEIVDGTLGAYPAWFTRMNADCPLPFSDLSEDYIPDQARAQDEQDKLSLGGMASGWNSRSIALKSYFYHRAIEIFVFRHPLLALERFRIGYHIFWQRMADFGGLLFDPLYVQPRDRPFPGLLSRGPGEKQRVMLSLRKGDSSHDRGARFWTVSLAPLDALSIAAIHFGLPCILLIAGHRRWRRKSMWFPNGMALAALFATYGLIMFSAFDVGENMRFRLSVEPEILALTAAILVTLVRAEGPAKKVLF